MKAVIISLGSVSSQWTAEAMKKYFSEVDVIDIREMEVSMTEEGTKVFHQGEALAQYDCVYLKGSYKYVQILSSIASALEGKAYLPTKADAFRIGHDKLLTHLKLQHNSIPMPSTYISSTPSSAKQLLERLNYPVVMKFPQGTQGKGVMFADSFSSAMSMLDALSALKQPVIIQDFVETGGTDIRAIVVGGNLVAAMKRKAVEGEKRANIHAGGSGEPCELDFHTKKLAVQTAESIGADICAVDILESSKGPVVIEVNLSPGLQGITSATGLDVADLIAKALYDNTKAWAEAGLSEETERVLDEITSSGNVNSIISNLELDGTRIVLPEIVTEMAGFSGSEEVTISADKNSVVLTKSKQAGK